MTAPKIETVPVLATGIRIAEKVRGKEVGHAFLYFLVNDLHKEPFGFMEDVFVEDGYRCRGFGVALVQRVIDEARRRGCYKLVATSRYSRDRVHAMYQKLGFKDCGHEFRIDLAK